MILRLFRTMEGGAETGFTHVEPEQYEARLFKFAKDKGSPVAVREVMSYPHAARHQKNSAEYIYLCIFSHFIPDVLIYMHEGCSSITYKF